MKTIYVIRDISNNKYLSVNNVFDDWNMCKEFESEADAIKELEMLYGYYVIEKVYKV